MLRRWKTPSAPVLQSAARGTGNPLPLNLARKSPGNSCFCALPVNSDVAQCREEFRGIFVCGQCRIHRFSL